MFLSLLKVSLVHSPISLRLLSLSRDLTILELALIPRSITHEQHPLSMLHSPLVVPLVLEERVVIGVYTLSLTQLSHWVQVAYVTIFGGDEVIFVNLFGRDLALIETLLQLAIVVGET